jgi:hypothetical protein
MLSVVILSVAMLSVVMLSVVMLSVAMLNVVMLSAVAPLFCCDRKSSAQNVYGIVTWGQCYKTFYGRKLQLFVKS